VRELECAHPWHRNRSSDVATSQRPKGLLPVEIPLCYKYGCVREMRSRKSDFVEQARWKSARMGEVVESEPT
jgi:hypothetical protein